MMKSEVRCDVYEEAIISIEMKIKHNVYYALRSFIVVRLDMHDFSPTSMKRKVIACASKFTLSL